MKYLPAFFSGVFVGGLACWRLQQVRPGAIVTPNTVEMLGANRPTTVGSPNSLVSR